MSKFGTSPTNNNPFGDDPAISIKSRVDNSIVIPPGSFPPQQGDTDKDEKDEGDRCCVLHRTITGKLKLTFLTKDGVVIPVSHATPAFAGNTHTIKYTGSVTDHREVECKDWHCTEKDWSSPFTYSTCKLDVEALNDSLNGGSGAGGVVTRSHTNVRWKFEEYEKLGCCDEAGYTSENTVTTAINGVHKYNHARDRLVVPVTDIITDVIHSPGYRKDFPMPPCSAPKDDKSSSTSLEN